MERILGIDPGLDGAFCIMVIDERSHDVQEIVFQKFPTIANEPDFQRLGDLFDFFVGCYGILEKVSAMPHQGVCSMFKFGRVYGAIQALLHCNRISHIEVRPQDWQKEIFVGVPAINKETKRGKRKDVKKMAEIQVRRMFPTLDLRPTPRCENFHSGMVDALLLAEWGRRHLPASHQFTENVIPFPASPKKEDWKDGA